MLLPSSFIIFCLLFSVGKCQFFYNYEEADGDDSPQNSDESTRYQYNSPAVVNQQYQQETKHQENDEIQRKKSDDSGNSEIVEERIQGPKRRAYRRILREGNYVEPTLSAKTYAPSVFENIGLGQAPNGVYIPQDSFLNALRNNRQSFGGNNAPSVYYQNNAPEQRFFAQPPTPVANREETSPAIEPNVQYAAENSGQEMTVRRNAQSTRPRRQRQQARPSSRPEPVVDIDVLRTPPDIMTSNTPVPFQGQRLNRGRSVSQNRQRLLIQDYPDASQPPKAYSPSAFQNIGLGEAPRGVDIPADSLLNVLRNPSANSYSSPRVAAENSQVSSHLDEQDSSQLAAPEEKPSQPSDSRRRSKLRSRHSSTSGGTVRRRTEYQYDDETQDTVQPVPAPSQQQRNQRPRNTDLRRSRGNAYDNQSTRRQQPARVESHQSQNAERQQKYKPARLAIVALPEDTDDDGIPGEAGIDHPILHVIPRTAFSCAEQLHNGFYADLETSCQVVHLCQAGGVKNSFLCPNGTIFSQEKFSCQWWYEVNCADSPKFYSINDSLYKVPEKKRQKAKE